MNSLQETAFQILGEGLADLKYISDKNDLDQIKKYFMHSFVRKYAI